MTRPVAIGFRIVPWGLIATIPEPSTALLLGLGLLGLSIKFRKRLRNRNRIALQVSETYGQLTAGLFRRRSQDLIDIEECPVSHPTALALGLAAVEAARHSGIDAWDPRTDGGALRTVLVRTNSTGQSGVTMVVRYKNRKEIATLARAGIDAAGLFLNVNKAGREKLLGGDR